MCHNTSEIVRHLAFFGMCNVGETMKEWERDKHDVVEMELEENVCVETIEKRFAMAEHGTLGSSGRPGRIHDDVGLFWIGWTH